MVIFSLLMKRTIQNALAAFTFVFLITGCSSSPVSDEVKQSLMSDLKGRIGDEGVAAEFLNKKGEEFLKNDFSPEAMGITISENEDQDSDALYIELITPLSNIAQTTDNRDYLTFFAHHNHQGLRADAAKNKYLSLENQKFLSDDEAIIVRSYLAANKSLKKEVALKLSEDEAQEVRWVIARNSTYKETWEKLVEDESPYVQEKLATNPIISEKIMLQIAEKSHEMAVLSLLKRTDLSDTVLKKIRLRPEAQIQEKFQKSFPIEE